MLGHLVVLMLNLALGLVCLLVCTWATAAWLFNLGACQLRGLDRSTLDRGHALLRHLCAPFILIDNAIELLVEAYKW